MPFTLSHTAACLPFLNRSKAVGWKPALVFGTMAPDLLFPIPYFGEREHTHSIKGLFALDVPFAFLFSVVWVFLLSGRLSRLPGLALVGKSDSASFSVLMSLAGALLGATTHLCWDLFTHMGSPVLKHPIFSTPLFGTSSGFVTLQSISWYSSGIFGCAILLWWVRKKLHHRSTGLRKEFLSLSWLRIYAAFLLPYLGILFVVALHRPVRAGQLLYILSRLVDVVRVGMFVSLVCAIAVAWWETRERRAPENA
jgi:hypothetical protein